MSSDWVWAAVEDDDGDGPPAPAPATDDASGLGEATFERDDDDAGDDEMYLLVAALDDDDSSSTLESPSVLVGLSLFIEFQFGASRERRQRCPC